MTNGFPASFFPMVKEQANSIAFLRPDILHTYTPIVGIVKYTCLLQVLHVTEIHMLVTDSQVHRCAVRTTRKGNAKSSVCYIRH
jgi:hypothetical protein